MDDWNALMAEIHRRRWRIEIGPGEGELGDHCTTVDIYPGVGQEGRGAVIQEDGGPKLPGVLAAAVRLCRELEAGG
jgi:hypothetical protein